MLRSLLTVLGLALPLALSAPLISPRQTVKNCTHPSAFHIIAARGSTEAQGEGPLQNVSSLIEAAVPGSDDVAVVYPALLLPYESSEESGVMNMTLMIMQYVNACPDSRIVLLGYSQGAQIVGDVLGGSSYGSPMTAPLGTAYTKNIAAAVQFGDPAHVTGKSYDYGTAKKDGVFARDDTTVLDTYAPILASYCMEHDIFCASGDSISVHTSEVQDNAQAAAEFVAAKA